MKPAPDRRWSVASRMGTTFALATCGIVLLYAAWSGWFVVSTIRTDLRNFIAHEIEELALAVRDTDRSTPALQRCVDHIVEVTESPKAAFRIRDASGAVVVSGGPRRLLEAVPEPVLPGDSWRAHVLDDGIAVGAEEMAPDGLRIEILVDAAPHVAAVREFLLAAAAAFLVSAGLAFALGRWAANRGLVGLREVVAQARGIGPETGGARILVENAPEEVRELGAALNALLERIDRGLESMRTFTAGLAHELRSPIQNILGEVEVALLQARTAEDYERVLRSNVEDLYDLSDAVDNLVAYCRSATPEPPGLAAEHFDLAEEVELRLQRERRTADRLGVQLVVHTEGDTALDGDREGSLRVVRNLVGNALQWAPPGSEVTVRVNGGESVVRLEVEDRGPGVPESIAPRIFEPFVSGRPKEGRRGGYGLGLTICRQVMEAHGGTLVHEPRAGGGARFVCEFPRRRPAPVPAGSPSS